MSFRVVVISSSAKLDLKTSYLVVRNEMITKIALSEIAVLVVESTATSVTTALLAELVKNKIKVIFCDEKRNPISEIAPYYGSHDTSLKVRMQIKWSNDVKGEVWSVIVAQKIAKQTEVLQLVNKKESVMLERYIEQIMFYDSTNREGHAAKVYFNALFGRTFTRSKESPINAALNYGYSLLLSAFNREIVTQGYLTQIGIFHDNMFNQFNLSCDLMEAFRPIVDLQVYYMECTEFKKEDKMNLIQILNKQVKIDGQKQYMLNAIKIYVKSVFDVLNQVEGTQIKGYRNEL
ncbi:MAG: type II CRISPR-associated endonuclease Cas1 [Eubacteriales bacterium]